MKFRPVILVIPLFLISTLFYGCSDKKKAKPVTVVRTTTATAQQEPGSGETILAEVSCKISHVALEIYIYIYS